MRKAIYLWVGEQLNLHFVPPWAPLEDACYEEVFAQAIDATLDLANQNDKLCNINL